MKKTFDIDKISRYLHGMGHSEQTIRSYIYGIKNYLNANPNADRYCYKDVLCYMSEKVKDFNNSDTKNTLLASIKKYYDFLIEIGARNNHPCRKIILKNQRHKEIIHQDLFSVAELEMLMDREERYEILKLKNQTLISLLIYQGLTAGELTKIKVKHVDLDNSIIYIKESRKLTKRHLDILPCQFDLIDSYINEVRNEIIRCDTDFLLIGKLGTPLKIDDINYLISTFKPMFPDRNLNPKSIRQSVIANWLNEKHIPLEQVQLLAGHRWISATIKYRNSPVIEQRELINRFHPLM